MQVRRRKLWLPSIERPKRIWERFGKELKILEDPLSRTESTGHMFLVRFHNPKARQFKSDPRNHFAMRKAGTRIPDFFVRPLVGKQEVTQWRGFRERPGRERNPNPLSRLFDEFCSSSGAIASKIAACPPVLVCSLPQ
jgi:hypothetical protein